MKVIPLLQKEFENEGRTTRKFLKAVPEDKFDWKPHEKNRSLLQLAKHIADLESVIEVGIHKDEYDLSEKTDNSGSVESSEELIDLFDKNYKASMTALNKAGENDLLKEWTMRNGEQVIAEMNTYGIIRQTISHINHHRAQLGVYLRLLDVPLPDSYGPTADDR